MVKERRQITQEQIAVLHSQGCRAESWENISVGEGFRPDLIHNCRFAGRVDIGDNVYISNVRGVLSNYQIHDNAYIEDVGRIVCPNRSSFGNGVRVVTVNEGGGREVPIFEGITAQIAYVIAMYRERTTTIERLEDIIQKLTDEQSDVQGVIGLGARIKGCGTIDSVRVGEGAVLEGVRIVKNGTIVSSEAAPTRIGHGVMLYDFITAEGVIIDNGSLLKRCFIGEACHIDCSFSGVDSLFFANSHFENGEACSIFAGPYTVSHHRSSLLIAGLFSFFNAGSGTNQSNHLFKTGAVHQAIHERGCKYASSGYVMAPARTGAFSVILDRHTSHHNTENFPFSYLTQSEGKTYLLPANNLRSYGTVRDMAKWPARDKRRGSKRDIINFEPYNPYIGEKLAAAITTSNGLLAKDGVDVYNYERVRIKSAMLRRGLGLYKMALGATLGSILEQGSSSDVDVDGGGKWVDIAGMYAPMSAINALLERIDNGTYDSVSKIDDAFVRIGRSYKDYAYSWALSMLSSTDNIAETIAQGIKDREALRELTDADAMQDSSVIMTTGYGIDATDKQQIADDFAAVRNKK